MNTLLILSGLLGLAVSLVLIPLILKLSSRLAGLQRAPDLHHQGVDSGKSIVDSTQAPKSNNLVNHQLSTINHQPVPRFGGLALALAFEAGNWLMVDG
jgi:UDP-N-acetylmuramyl pentapeptide phosphotransferase/UDP-N-acetylglucosamine-1-phosphate transferase